MPDTPNPVSAISKLLENLQASESFADHCGNDDEDLGPQPRLEGDILHLPPRWIGPLSGCTFRSDVHKGAPLISLLIPYETEHVVQLLTTSGDQGEYFINMLDFGLAVATDPEAFDPDDIELNAMTLCEFSHLFASTAKEIKTEVKRARKQILEPHRKAQEEAIEGQAILAKALKRTAKRVDQVLVGSVKDPRVLSILKETAGLHPPKRCA